MPYAQISDVRGLIPHVNITRDSQPSEGTVQTWISEVETMLNANLRAMGYAIPLTAQEGKTTSAAVTMLKHAVTHAVAAMILRSRPNPESDPNNFQSRYDAFMKALRDPKDPTELPDVVITGEATVKAPVVRVSSNLRDLLDEDAHVRRNQVF